MLDGETKRHIDNARDVLVGKVPNPISQIDMITTALIYKFMDDMDMSAVELGGSRQFFTGDLEPYSWSALLSPQQGNQNRLNLYAEALEKLKFAPQIPALFRSIFKDAFLPFRDGETLSLFLKEIQHFSYSNSETLGNGFEYLLSIMGSQGDAGQFRTPRHIIDFIVQAVNPSHTDTVLDPACGTAGFLISAYRHMLNTRKLTLEDKKRITANISGYDIDPTMVKLARVNLYLHNFVDPKIYEYDTLTSEQRWDDGFDLILANPPFMTPKGGIKPHGRFSIQAKRSEVLFVDYIAGHLKANGRAGIIVPEGIIFQSANAYKALRKMLVERYLCAVVSLPAGVFQPYSGVKTSILLLDKGFSKKSDSILFVKIENDGFDLGAQRRAIPKNDLPQALRIIEGYRRKKTAESAEDAEKNSAPSVSSAVEFLIVPKAKIAENGEYSLTGERYKAAPSRANRKWEMVKLGDVCEKLFAGGDVPKDYAKEKKDDYEIPIYTNGIGAKSLYGFTNKKRVDQESITISARGTIGYPEIRKPPFYPAIRLIVAIPKSSVLDIIYLKYILETIKFEKNGNTIPQLTVPMVEPLTFPLPPLSVQQEIVAKIEGYQKVIDGARQVADNWKPRIEIDESWETVKLGDVCEKLFAGGDVPKDYAKEKKDDYEIPIYTNGIGAKSLYGFTNKKRVDQESITISARGTIGYPEIRKPPFYPAIRLIVAIPKSSVLDIIYLKYILETIKFEKNGNTIPQLTVPMVEPLTFPLPPLSAQQAIVAEIEQEREIVDGNKRLIALYESKIKRVINKVWEE